MPRYLVAIHGQNFLVEVEGKVGRYGFYTFRFPESADPKAAEYDAVDAVRRTERLREMVRNAKDDPPVMDVTEIAELDPTAEVENPEPGFIWYEESPKRWWQFWKR